MKYLDIKSEYILNHSPVIIIVIKKWCQPLTHAVCNIMQRECFINLFSMS
jgi:hypothetical protein